MWSQNTEHMNKITDKDLRRLLRTLKEAISNKLGSSSALPYKEFLALQRRPTDGERKYYGGQGGRLFTYGGPPVGLR